MSIDKIVQDTGYGMVSRKILRDKDLPLQSKGIYAYLAGFAGTTGRAFPSVELITNELGISKGTFYRYLRILRDSGIIEVKKERAEDGTFDRNVYYIHDKQPCIKSPQVDKPCMDEPYVANVDTISNNLNINNLNSNKDNNNIVADANKQILTSTIKDEIMDKWNQLDVKNIRAISTGTKRHDSLRARIKEYGLDDVYKAIDLVGSSEFLKGESARGWEITFDWFVKPNNFIKVLEGNYSDKRGGDHASRATENGQGSNGEIGFDKSRFLYDGGE